MKLILLTLLIVISLALPDEDNVTAPVNITLI